MFKKLYTFCRTQRPQPEYCLADEIKSIKDELNNQNIKNYALIEENIKLNNEALSSKMRTDDDRNIEFYRIFNENTEKNDILFRNNMSSQEELLNIKINNIDKRFHELESTILYHEENSKTLFNKIQTIEEELKNKTDENYTLVESLEFNEIAFKKQIDSTETYMRAKIDELFESIRNVKENYSRTNDALNYNNTMLHTKIDCIRTEIVKTNDEKIESIQQEFIASKDSFFNNLSLIKEHYRKDMNEHFEATKVINKTEIEMLSKEQTKCKYMTEDLSIKVNEIEKQLKLLLVKHQLTNDKDYHIEEQIKIMSLLTNDTYKFIKCTTAKILYRILDIEGNVNVFSGRKENNNSFVKCFNFPESYNVVKPILNTIAKLIYNWDIDHFLNTADDIIWDKSYSHELIYNNSNLEEDIQKSVSMIKSSYWGQDSEYSNELKILQSYDKIKPYLGKMIGGRPSQLYA